MVQEPGTLRLARIRVYPLKGAAGVDLEETELDVFGIPGDRRWMLVRPNGQFISQRTHPRLCLLEVGLRNGGQRVAEAGEAFSVNAPGMESVPLRSSRSPERWLEVQVHEDRFQALQGDEETDRWFSLFLEEPCKLVYMPESVLRAVDPEFAPGHRVSFSDGYPLHLATEESLQALNGKLRMPLNMVRFRPNLVVRGGTAWEEDAWRRLEVGTVSLDLVKPCARCTVPTVDPGSGTRGREPLRTLRGFREWGGRVYFGQNGVFLGQGKIRKGDTVRIVSEGDPRPPLPRSKP